MSAFIVALMLVPQVIAVSPAAPGQCLIAAGEARVVLKAPDCKAIRPINRAADPLLAVDWRFADRTERLLMMADARVLRIVLRRTVRSESLPVEESGDTLRSTARIEAMPGPSFGGLPLLVETQRSWATQFNLVDRKPDDVEVARTVFAFDGTRYRAVPAPSID